MSSLADKAILSGADNRPPMLEKDMYDSWRSRMELYMLNRQHGRMIPESEWIQMLMQGTLLTKQERECKLYDVFDKFAYQKGETLCDFYLIFSLLLNDMNMYNMKLEQFQVNTKFLNTLPPEWITDTSSLVNHNAYMASSLAPQIDYAPMVQQSSEYSPPEARLVVPFFQKEDDPIDAINHMMCFLTAVVTSRYPATNNQLRTSSNPRQQATINNGQKNTLSSSKSAPTFAEFFEINELKAQAQAKDTVILQLKEKLCSLKGDVTERNAKREVEEIETLNIELDHKEKVLVIAALKEQLSKLKGKAVLTEAVSLNPIDPELLKVNVAPLVPKLRKNRTAHTD
nr:hypothetical protein [Tanacetum cinerariifolium]